MEQSEIISTWSAALGWDHPKMEATTDCKLSTNMHTVIYLKPPRAPPTPPGRYLRLLNRKRESGGVVIWAAPVTFCFSSTGQVNSQHR